jgi:hypothetical protein
VALDAVHIAFEWNVVNNLRSGIGLPAAGVRLSVASAGRVLEVDSERGAIDGACSGYTDLTSLSLQAGYAVAELTSPVGWEIVRVALTEPGRSHRPWHARASLRPRRVLRSAAQGDSCPPSRSRPSEWCSPRRLRAEISSGVAARAVQRARPAHQSRSVLRRPAPEATLGQVPV